MNEVYESLQHLINAVLESEIYHKYKLQCTRVNMYPELKAQIDDYRNRNLELQTSENTTFEQLDRFEQEYAGFRDNPIVSDFLAAELAFVRMMQDINLKLTEAIQFE